MNLQRVEERCLFYLGEASNPLAPASALLEHCLRDDECAGLTQETLLDFLRAHELIHVVEGPDAHEAVGVHLFADAGFDMGPRAILNARIPSAQEMAVMLKEQLKVMTDALSSAMTEAKQLGDESSIGHLADAVQRAQAIRDRIEKLF